MTHFDPDRNAHPIPLDVENWAAIAGVPHRVCYAMYLTLDFAPGDTDAQYTPTELAGIIAELWDRRFHNGPGDRQDLSVYRCKEG